MFFPFRLLADVAIYVNPHCFTIEIVIEKKHFIKNNNLFKTCTEDLVV